jgi:hypothetical protein
MLWLVNRFFFHENADKTELGWRFGERTKRSNKGFLLNKVRGGYSVAIAGFITLLPWITKKRKNARRDRFTIARLHPKRQNIVVL